MNSYMTWRSPEQTSGKYDICCNLENVPVFLESASVSESESDSESAGCYQLQVQNQFKNFEYISSNIAGPGLEGTDPQEVQYSGCTCQSPSCTSSCPCLQRFGPNYTTSGKLIQIEAKNHPKAISGVNIAPSKPLFECNASCRCGEECVNRLVQNGICNKMEVFRTCHKGLGLRVLESIEENSFVCEYAGEVINQEEAQLRMKSMTTADMNYIFVLRENFGGHSLMETFIDARLKGSIARFINHSCEPNLYLVAVRVHNEVPRVAMFAKRDIEPGEELSYQYCGNMGRCNNEETVNGTVGDVCKDKSRKFCMCESKSCQKYLPRDSSICPD